MRMVFQYEWRCFWKRTAWFLLFAGIATGASAVGAAIFLLPQSWLSKISFFLQGCAVLLFLWELFQTLGGSLYSQDDIRYFLLPVGGSTVLGIKSIFLLFKAMAFFAVTRLFPIIHALLRGDSLSVSIFMGKTASAIRWEDSVAIVLQMGFLIASVFFSQMVRAWLMHRRERSWIGRIARFLFDSGLSLLCLYSGWLITSVVQSWYPYGISLSHWALLHMETNTLQILSFPWIFLSNLSCRSGLTEPLFAAGGSVVCLFLMIVLWIAAVNIWDHALERG